MNNNKEDNSSSSFLVTYDEYDFSEWLVDDGSKERVEEYCLVQKLNKFQKDLAMLMTNNGQKEVGNMERGFIKFHTPDFENVGFSRGSVLYFYDKGDRKTLDEIYQLVIDRYKNDIEWYKAMESTRPLDKATDCIDKSSET